MWPMWEDVADGPSTRSGSRWTGSGTLSAGWQSRALKLPVVRQETFTLHTFGSAAPLTTKGNTVKLVLESLRNKGQKIEIEAIETP